MYYGEHTVMYEIAITKDPEQKMYGTAGQMETSFFVIFWGLIKSMRNQ